jgi:single-stranded DNA-binding protein
MIPQVDAHPPHPYEGESPVDTDLNHVTLTGVLERDPITRFADHGTQQVSFTLRLLEVGPAGQAFTLFVPVEAFSQVAELAGDLSAGDAVMVAGKLKWTSYTAKDGSKKSNLAVLARLLKRLVLAPQEIPA